jgi:hypothetical protein
LRRCAPGENGAVITRYQGITDHDWIAMPLLPYLYAVENASEVPSRADRETVRTCNPAAILANFTMLTFRIPRSIPEIYVQSFYRIRFPAGSFCG